MFSEMQKQFLIVTLAALSLTGHAQVALANEAHGGLGIFVTGNSIYSSDTSGTNTSRTSLDATTYGIGVSYQFSVTPHIKAMPFFMYNAFGNGIIQSNGAKIPIKRVTYAALGVEGRYMWDSGIYLGLRISGGKFGTTVDAFTGTANGFTFNIPAQNSTSNTSPLLGPALGVELGNFTLGLYNDMGKLSGKQVKFGLYGAMLGWRF